MSTLPALLNPALWDMLKSQAEVIFKSGFVPRGVDSPVKVLAIMLKGHEMGLPPMLSLSEISIVEGKPTISANLMLSLIYSKMPGAEVNFVQMDDEACVIHAKRPGGNVVVISFTIEDAKKAGLLEKNNKGNYREPWFKYRRAMLRSRCVTEMVRVLFYDVVTIGYTPDEIDPSQPINVDETMSEPIKAKPLNPAVVESPKPGYNPSNTKHVESLYKKLDEMNLRYLFDKVSLAMVGLKSSEMISTIEKVKAEDDVEFALNIPFGTVENNDTKFENQALPVLTNVEKLDTIVSETKQGV